MRLVLKKYPDHVIVRDLLYFPKKQLGRDDYRLLKSSNMLKDPFSKEVISLFSEFDDYIGVPLYSVTGIKKAEVRVVDKRATGHNISFNTKTTLKDGQTQVAEDFQKYLSKGASGFVLKAPTAW